MNQQFASRTVAVRSLRLLVAWISILGSGCSPARDGTGESHATKAPPAAAARSSAQKESNAENLSLSSPAADRNFQVRLVYSPQYLIDLGGLERMHPFDIRKYEKIHQQLIADGLVAEESFLAPQRLSDDELKLIHSENYLNSFADPAKLARYLEAPILQTIPLDLEQAVVEPFRVASGGTLLAARQALESGVSVNLGGGYHHAKPDTGEGFCIIADIPIAIRKLQQENKIRTALIIDVDVHQGNGTSVCLANDETTFTFSMHQGDIYPIPKENGDLDVELDAGMEDEEYLGLLQENLTVLFQTFVPDICFIVGGSDTLKDDPLANLAMTHEGLVKRDAMIVSTCVERKIPVVLTLSGGYSRDAWRAHYLSIKHLIETYSLADEPGR